MSSNQKPAVTKILSFLGKGAYDETRYHRGGKPPVDTRLVQEALATWFPTARLVLFGTPEAIAANRHALDASIGDRCEFVEVSAGHDLDQIWQIFESIRTAVDQDDVVVIDITHGFRSQPVILLAASTFLEESGHARVADVVYGAYRGTPDTEVVSLAPFLQLTRWAVAVDNAVSHGSYEQVMRLLSGENGSDRDSRQIGIHLHEFSLALETNRVEHVFESARGLADRVTAHLDRVRNASPNSEDGSSDWQSLRWQKPLEPILERALETAERLALAEGASIEERVSASVSLIEHLASHHAWQQAITVTREAFVSTVCDAAGLKRDSHRHRELAEDFLNELASSTGRPQSPEWRSPRFPRIKDVVKSTRQKDVDGKLANSWKDIRRFRNSISHCGYTKDQRVPESGEQLVERLSGIIARACTALNAGLVQDSLPAHRAKRLRELLQ